MFDPEDELETWCPVCDKRIPQLKPPPKPAGPKKVTASTTGAVKKGPPGKFITPIAPTFKRSKTGTIKARPPSISHLIQPPATDSTTKADGLPAAPPPQPSAISANFAHNHTATSDNPAGGPPKPPLFDRRSSSTKLPARSQTAPLAAPTPADPPPSAEPHSPLYCSAACQRLDESRSSFALTTHLSSYSPSSSYPNGEGGAGLIDGYWANALQEMHLSSAGATSHAAGGGPVRGVGNGKDGRGGKGGGGGKGGDMCPPSPFFISGSDSEGGEYFLHQHDEEEETPHPSLGRSAGAGAVPGKRAGGGPGPFERRGEGSNANNRRDSRSTTVSSSDSLNSLFSSSNASSATRSHSGGSSHLKRMTPLPVLLSPTLIRPISAQSLIPPPPPTPPLLDFVSSSPRYPSSPEHQKTANAAHHLLPRSNSSLSQSSMRHQHELKHRSNSHSYYSSSSSSHTTSRTSPPSPPSYSPQRPILLNPNTLLRPSGSTTSLSSQNYSPSSTGFTTNVPEFDPYNINQFEPGSAPATASLYASYAASFNSHRSSASISSSHRSSFSSQSRRPSSAYGKGGGGSSSTNLVERGRIVEAESSSSYRNRSTDSNSSSNDRTTVFSSSYPIPSPPISSNTSSSTVPVTRNTPTQSLLSSSRRSESLLRRSSTALSAESSESSNDSRSSGGGDADGEGELRRSNCSGVGGGAGGRLVASPGKREPPQTSWSWGESERLYEIPRVPNSAAVVGGTQASGGGAREKLFYFGG